MKDNTFKTFIQDTYKSSSPIPYIITIQVGLFVLVHIFDLISSQANPSINLYQGTISTLSLPPLFTDWITQPWSIITHPFVYTQLFSLLFDCLWLYWIGNMYLNLLSRKHLLFTFCGGLLIGAVIFLLANTIPFVSTGSTPWTSITFGLASLLGGLIILSPRAEVKLFIFGNVSLKTIAFVYFFIEIAFLVYNNQYAAAIAFVAALSYSTLYTRSLLNGNDWSKIFGRKKKKHLKIVHSQTKPLSYQKNDLPNQELIDQVLDKISSTGYDSLSAMEKEILFKASKEN